MRCRCEKRRSSNANNNKTIACTSEMTDFRIFQRNVGAFGFKKKIIIITFRSISNTINCLKTENKEDVDTQ